MSHEPMHKIIKLKRYERPPEGYYDDFLREFHRRQRTELLNPSLSTLIMERLHSMMAELRVPAMAFAGAAAVAVMASVAIIRNTPVQDTPQIHPVAYTAQSSRTNYQVPVTVQGEQPISLRVDAPQQQAPQFPATYILQAHPANPDSAVSF
jgi:hypothetical protein